MKLLVAWSCETGATYDYCCVIFELLLATNVNM